jgi:O-antigen/teichoic acid export membrane protein
MVAASLLSAVCGIVQTFWIPRLLSVDGYGYWRMFLLYMGYAGLLHLGLVDGALLLWSKAHPKASPNRTVLGRSLQFLLAEQLALITVAVILLRLKHASPDATPLLAAFAVYTLLFNLLCITQVYLQVHAQFGLVALGNSLPGLLFVVLLAGLALGGHVTVNALLLAYLIAWMGTVAVLLIQAFRFNNAIGGPYPDPPAPAQSVKPARWRPGLEYIAAGWPIMLASTGYGLMQSADRVTVNLTRPIHDFAIYSLSQSTIYVPITILAALSRVAFTYFARATDEGRSGLYRSSTRTITLLWMLLLPYYFAVEFVVARFLPKYVPGLPAGRILLFSVLFLSLIQIVQLNTYSLEGRQRQFFLGSIVAVAVAFATAWIGSRVIGTLTAVALSQVITAALWWLANEYFLRQRTGMRPQDILRVILGLAVSSAALAGVEAIGANCILASILYLLLILPTSAFLFPHERRLLTQRLARLRRVEA